MNDLRYPRVLAIACLTPLLLSGRGSAKPVAANRSSMPPYAAVELQRLIRAKQWVELPEMSEEEKSSIRELIAHSRRFAESLRETICMRKLARAVNPNGIAPILLTLAAGFLAILRGQRTSTELLVAATADALEREPKPKVTPREWLDQLAPQPKARSAASRKIEASAPSAGPSSRPPSPGARA